MQFPWKEQRIAWVLPEDDVDTSECGYMCAIHVSPEIAAQTDPKAVFSWLYAKCLEALERIGEKTRLGRPPYGAHLALPSEFAPEPGVVRLVALPRLVKKIANLDDEQKAVLVPVDKMRGADAWEVDLGAISATVPRSVRGRAEFVEQRIRASGVLPKEKGTWGNSGILKQALDPEQSRKSPPVATAPPSVALRCLARTPSRPGTPPCRLWEISRLIVGGVRPRSAR